MAAAHDGVVVVHGTDRLAKSGERMVTRWARRRCRSC
jgi:L-asparaginase/Glu-tRNA(Gln) amidotransferase subunit D